jgi:hypothetical protein
VGSLWNYCAQFVHGVKFEKKLGVPGVQLVAVPGVRKYITNGTTKTLVVTAWDWLAALP